MRIDGGFRAVLLAPLLLIGACATLPDLSGYTAATVEVRSSIAAAGTAVGAEIDEAALTVEEPNRAAIQQIAGNYRKAWDQNLKAMDAMVRYAESIEAIAAAGNQGRESALAVAQQVRDLAGGLGVPLAPVAAPLDAVVATGAFVYGELAKVEAARSLEAALAASGPSILRLQALVLAQVGDSRTAFASALAQHERALRSPGAYQEQIVAEQELRERIAALGSRVAALPPGDPSAPRLRAELELLAQSSAALAPALAEYRRKLDAIAARRKAGMALLDAAEAALDAWGAAHVRLATAVRSGAPVTLASLDAAVADLRGLIKKWRDL